jgi:hypothetical protein
LLSEISPSANVVRRRVFLTKTAKSQFVSKPGSGRFDSRQLGVEHVRFKMAPERLSHGGDERRRDYQRADAIKRANSVSWRHVNLYGAYSFLDIGDGVELQRIGQSLGGSPR